MKRSKTALAAFVAAAALISGGAAAALTLPEQAADEARTATTGVEATGSDHAKNDDATDDSTEAEDTDEAKTEATEDAEDAEDAEESGERPTDTHGYEVSTFATTTELEGQEKGAAISELARTNGGAEDDEESDATADDASATGAEKSETGKAKAAHSGK